MHFEAPSCLVVVVVVVVGVFKECAAETPSVLEIYFA